MEIINIMYQKSLVIDGSLLFLFLRGLFKSVVSFVMLCAFLVVFCVSSCFGQVDYATDSPYRSHPEGKVVWTLGITPMYVAPDTQAVLHKMLLAATPLHLLERLDETEKRQGFCTNWYRVFQDRQEGFVWGGDLALAQLVMSSGTFTYGLKSIKTVEYDNYQEPQLELAIITSREGRITDSIHITAVGTVYTQTKAQLKGSQGLVGVEQVVEIAFSDGYCGGIAATTTLLWDGNHWYNLGVLSQGFGDNHFSNVYYNFPQQHQKGSNLLELCREEGYYNQQHQPIYTLQKKQWYEWTGTALLQVEGVVED